MNLPFLQLVLQQFMLYSSLQDDDNAKNNHFDANDVDEDIDDDASSADAPPSPPAGPPASQRFAIALYQTSSELDTSIAFLEEIG